MLYRIIQRFTLNNLRIFCNRMIKRDRFVEYRFNNNIEDVQKYTDIQSWKNRVEIQSWKNRMDNSSMNNSSTVNSSIVSFMAIFVAGSSLFIPKNK